MDSSLINNENLSHYIIINQMVSTTGCRYEQAEQLLISTDWKLQVFISKIKENFIFLILASN
jgi:hypothetical protein